VYYGYEVLGHFMLMQLTRPNQNRHDAELRRLATVSASGITLAGLVLLAIIAYTGWSSNESSKDRERTLLQNALNLCIARSLNEQKSVAWWDEAVVKITDQSVDLDFTDSEFGVFLTETYGHDEVYILNGQEQPLYAFTNGARAKPSAFEAHRAALAAVIAEVRGSTGFGHLPPGGVRAGLKRRPDAFGADQSSYRTIGGPVDIAGWAGHILVVEGNLAVVAVLTIVPNVDMNLLKHKPNLLISVTYVDDAYVTELGRSLLLNDLALVPQPELRDGVVSEPFDGDDGAHGGYLTWTTQRTGQVLLHTILPLVASGVIAVAVLAGGMLRRLQRSSNELAERDQQSRHDASHDALSALPNRPHFAEKLQEALDSLVPGSNEMRVIVAYIDIDRFKDVNDTLGHPAGDELIKVVAQRLRGQMRPNSVLSRYGGDEFAILWVASGQNAGDALAKRIEQAFAAQFEVGGQNLLVKASVGIALSEVAGTTVDELMRQADIALYEAKAQGRNRCVFFADDMARRIEERRAIEIDLRLALAGNLLRLNYQPIISCHTGEVVGVEALLRWRHPQLGEIPPATFIPIAEQSGLMPELGEWVLRRTMQDSRLWPQLQVSVNLSPVQFKQTGLETLLASLIDEYRINPSQFVLEITEGVLMELCDRTSHTLDSIHTMGFLTALDDFGTGYSSLSYLCNFRFDKIKVDRSFVAGMSKSESYEKIVHAVVALGKGLGMEIVAEGVENELEAIIMTKLGCSELQGYYFSKPVETAQMCRLLETHKPWETAASLAAPGAYLPVAAPVAANG
jgi:diguanylate cyclase (GGDEF)-like protein